MNQAQVQRHLSQIERHVTIGAGLVRRQRSLVADMERRGRPTATAAKLLDTIESLQASYVADRDSLRAWFAEHSAEPHGRASPVRRRVASDMPEDEPADPRAVAAALDQLAEQTYSILSSCGVPGGLTEQQAISQLLGLFESGGGFEARVQAEQLLRPGVTRTGRQKSGSVPVPWNSLGADGPVTADFRREADATPPPAG